MVKIEKIKYKKGIRNLEIFSDNMFSLKEGEDFTFKLGKKKFNLMRLNNAKQR